MRSTSLLATSLLLAVLPARPAFAQDLDGPYAGAQGGREQTDVRNPESDLGTLVPGDDRRSFTGGAFVGFDRRIAPDIVLGAEGGIDFPTGDAVASAGGTGVLSVDPEWSIDLTARAGYRLGSSTLAYVRGGYTNARVETAAAGGASRLTYGENRDGWQIGAGIERLLLQNISGRLEYFYSDLGEGDGAYDRHRFLAGIAYRF